MADKSWVKAWDSTTAFDRCAEMLLDTLEESFHILAPDGRSSTKRALLGILGYFCVPKDGPDGTSAVELEIRANRQ